MSRKKKAEIVEKQEEKHLVEKKENAIKYNGRISVTIKNGSRVISSKVYHNNGGNALFRFLLQCICGTYNQNERPVFIKLFGGDAAPVSDIAPTGTIGTGNISYSANSIYTDEGTVCAVLHFTVPCAYISIKNIYQAALYSSKYAASDETSINNFCALFNFKDDMDDWAPIQVSTTSSDYNIFIDWTMNFTNGSSSN